MNKVKRAVVIFLGIIAAFAGAFFIIGYVRPRSAGIYVETNPRATVYIDGIQVGRTPFRKTIKPSEIVLKLVPDSFQIPLSPYETKITLVASVETVVKRDFGNLDETSAGEIISFEKIANGDTSLVIVSIPDAVEVSIDGNGKRTTPFKINSISDGQHKITLNEVGYKERTLMVRTHKGYKLTALVQLARDTYDVANSGDSQQPSITPTPPTKSNSIGKIQILATPVGYLRIRDSASTLSNEVGRVSPGETFDLVAVDDKTGWYEIEFQSGKLGWISNEYAKKIQVSVSPSITPVKTVTPTSSF